MQTLIRNGVIVTAADTYKADILIEEGVIAAIGQGFQAETVIHAAGKYVFPGFILPRARGGLSSAAGCIKWPTAGFQEATGLSSSKSRGIATRTRRKGAAPGQSLSASLEGSCAPRESLDSHGGQADREHHGNGHQIAEAKAELPHVGALRGAAEAPGVHSRR
jgi:hypothetical protein